MSDEVRVEEACKRRANGIGVMGKEANRWKDYGSLSKWIRSCWTGSEVCMVLRL